MTESRTISMPPCDYQPSKAELEAEYDMPDADPETVRHAFFGSYHVKTEKC